MTDLEQCRYVRTVKMASTVEQFKSKYDGLISIYEANCLKLELMLLVLLTMALSLVHLGFRNLLSDV